MPWLVHRIPPPVVGAAVAAAMWGAAPLGPPLVFAAGPWTVVVALLAVAGLALDALGLFAFVSSRTSFNPLRPDRARVLVTTGVYRFTRNPMYLATALWLLAWALHLNAWLPFAGPVAFVLFITRFQIRPEERVLAQRFGEAYAAYAAGVRRWL